MRFIFPLYLSIRHEISSHPKRRVSILRASNPLRRHETVDFGRSERDYRSGNSSADDTTYARESTYYRGYVGRSLPVNRSRSKATVSSDENIRYSVFVETYNYRCTLFAASSSPGLGARTRRRTETSGRRAPIETAVGRSDGRPETQAIEWSTPRPARRSVGSRQTVDPTGGDSPAEASGSHALLGTACRTSTR